MSSPRIHKQELDLFDRQKAPLMGTENAKRLAIVWVRYIHVDMLHKRFTCMLCMIQRTMHVDLYDSD